VNETFTCPVYGLKVTSKSCETCTERKNCPKTLENKISKAKEEIKETRVGTHLYLDLYLEGGKDA